MLVETSILDDVGEATDGVADRILKSFLSGIGEGILTGDGVLEIGATLGAELDMGETSGEGGRLKADIPDGREKVGDGDIPDGRENVGVADEVGDGEGEGN